MVNIWSIIEKVLVSLILAVLKWIAKLIPFLWPPPRPVLPPPPPTPRTRIYCVCGQWTGTFTQKSGPAPQKGTDRLDAEFTVEEESIHGTMLLHSGQERFGLVLRGSLEHDSYVRLTYNGKDKNMKHFGCLLLELDPKGDELTGQYLGFGVQAKAMVTGTIFLDKISSDADR